jgi:hypothetical protein
VQPDIELLAVAIDDGTERDVTSGEIQMPGASHVARVVDNEPAVLIDFHGMVDYARQGQDCFSIWASALGRRLLMDNPRVPGSAFLSKGSLSIEGDSGPHSGKCL